MPRWQKSTSHWPKTSRAPEPKHPGSGIVCPSHTYLTGERCYNQWETALENKGCVAETHTPTHGSFAGYHLRHEVELHHAT
ncbi:hypothetical protein TNCT_191551 [Trichonephila clavata]|uniref:Uncharacterized protein n=1 Tax=Trichonephila clavata TaxID=2740835 RepID=A0A8X6LC71_TRICU|nr:hypothetical protein TNCT_191551 [Trichonephila clavata]